MTSRRIGELAIEANDDYYRAVCRRSFIIGSEAALSSHADVSWEL